MKLLLLYRRRWWLFYLPVLLCAAAALWWSFAMWKVLPPGSVVIAAGSRQDSYSQLAQRYADQLERSGMNVEISYADSQRGSLDQLTNPRNPSSVGFAQGFYAEGAAPVQALAVIGQEPVWVFSAEGGPASLAQAGGARLAAGSSTSSSFMAARAMLEHAGVRLSDVRISSQTGMAAAQALIEGKVELVFQAGGEDAQAVQMLMRQPGVRLLGTEHAAALTAHEPHLRVLLLPQGAIELRGDIPPQDLTLMSVQTHLLVRPDLHPAL